MKDLSASFDTIRRLLAAAVGPEHGITIDRLTHLAGLSSRRDTEALLQGRLADLPFVVVADGHGYYRPTSAEQINAYRGSLRRRHQPLVEREHIVTRKARAAGYPLEGDTFKDPPKACQLELIA